MSTPEERIANVERQISAFTDDAAKIILCPYCTKATVEGDKFCCKSLMQAVTVILDRRQLEQNIHDAEKIKDRLSVS